MTGVYAGTQGAVDRPASKRRITPRLQTVLLVLRDREERGATWQEVATELGLHHGQASGALSNLHRMGLVFALRETRNGCHPYVHAAYRHTYYDSERFDEPAQTKRGRQVELSNDLLAALGRWAEYVNAYGTPGFAEYELLQAFNTYKEGMK